MKYHFGFLNNDLTFQPYSEASRSCIHRKMFISWYECEPQVLSLKEEVERAILSLPKNCILLSGGTVLDDVITTMASSLREDLSVKTFAPPSRYSLALYRWIKENRYSYFLTSTHQAFVLMEAEKLLQSGKNVALIGPLPIVKDNFWMLSKTPGVYSFVEAPPHWVVSDGVKNTSAFLMADKYYNLTPNLMFKGNIFVAYLRELDLKKNGSVYRKMGIREFLRGEALARMLLPRQFSDDRLLPQARLKWSPVLSKRRWVNFRSPVSRYCETLNQGEAP